MTSKTPQFDMALDMILRNLKPHDRTCAQCGGFFHIFLEDIEFYRMLRVPAPQQCPECRRRRRLAFLNYSTLYRRKCDAPGHGEELISSSPPDADYPVYDHAYWWSDAWDPLAYGRSYESKRKFFSQFRDLLKDFPMPSSTRDPASVNSEYTLYGIQLKNCYYVFGGLFSEDILYGNWPISSRQCMDVLITLNCEKSYQVVYGTNCYNCNFAYFSEDCLDCDFIFDCRDCRHCFGCVNLRHKQFCFFNEQLSEVEYKKRREAVFLGDRIVLEAQQRRFEQLIKQRPVRGVYNKRAQNSIGNFLVNCKDCFTVAWAFDSENLRYGELTMNMRDSIDFTLGFENERVYEGSNAGRRSSDVRCVLMCREGLGLEYCANCFNCEHCFGCIGLRNKKYCVLNKQVTPETYWPLVDSIKTAMLAAGEYGEFFPMSFSHYPYNASLAGMVFPLFQGEAERLGAAWFEKTSLEPREASAVLRAPQDLPRRIDEAGDEILAQVIASERSGKPFRLAEEELTFYRKKGLPLPTLHPDERMSDRFKAVNYFRVAMAPCARCGKEIPSAYLPEDGWRVYCENCYNSEVI